jgi:Neuraminidase-like domain/FHA domain
MSTDNPGSPRLVVTEPAERAGTALTLAAPELVIGHSDTADLILEDRFVSRRHALVSVDPSGQVTIRDLNSTGGTFVNEERLAGPRVLQPGDLVRFADLVARFEPGIPPALAAPPDPGASGQAGPSGEATQPGAPAGAAPGPGSPHAPDGSGGAGGAGDACEPGEDGTTYTVTGTVASPALPAVAGMTVRLLDKNIGGDQVLGVTQTTSDGSYRFSRVITGDYLARHHKTQPDLQVQVLSGDSVLAASGVSYSAPATVTLDVVLPSGTPGLPSEYETLTAGLAATYPGRLGALQENASQQDITYLANKAGWDARAVALAALADQFSQHTAPVMVPLADPGQTQALPGLAATAPLPAAPGAQAGQTVSMRAEFYYALFRAGLPASADSLYQTPAATVQTVLQQATAQGVVSAALAKDVPAAVRSFQALSAAHLLTAAPPAGVSTLQEMLQTTLPEPAQQEQFARLYAQYADDPGSLWTASAQAFGTAATARLQLTGQLYYLTVNNEPLVSALLAAEASNPITSPQDLATLGYYDPAKWAPLIGASIPPQIPGSDADEQASNYAQLLAAQVRISYPTTVVADQVRRAILPTAGGADVAAGVTAFLTEQSDFAIGAEPVEAYIARTGVPQPPPATVAAIKRIQRVYQLTPDDASMAMLLHHNLDSAFAITRYDAAGFTRAFGGRLGGEDRAAMIHQRASQVFASTLSLAVGYLGGRVTPSFGGSSPVQYGFAPAPAPPSFPVTAYPTLEDLFGSLDYCNCTDCGSILSPAAYLVDLLNYIDQPAPSAGGGNPLEVLLSRRPDLQYLPLTCANTNTALPYIDVVNELLEYVVANDLHIAGYQGHDTGDAVTSADLVASPQYVNDTAYEILQTAFFPPPLPYNRPLELLRAHLASLGVTLPAAMTALRASDDLTSTSTPTSYGWNDILIEQLTISRDEYRLFTDATLDLPDLYGLPGPAAAALSTLQGTSLEDFSRRLGVSYDGLVSIVQTQFINPNAALIPRLEQLNASFATLQQLNATVNTPQSIAADFIAALPAGLDATQYGGSDPSDYQAVVAWVTNPANYQRILSIIVVTDPSGGGDDCSGASLRLRYSNPDNTANLLSGTDFIKIIRFVRLWRKLAPLLGDPSDAVTIEQTDDILGALYPAADLPADPGNAANDTANRPLLDHGFAALLPRAGFLFQLMDSLKLTADTGLDQLLACWAPIGTAGANSLYRNMFLTPTLLQHDPGAQTATVASTVNAGDVLHTVINGQEEIPAYTVPPGQTAAQVAVAIAQAINTSAAPDLPDPASGLQLSQRFAASASSGSGVITIKAGFTLGCGAAGAAGGPATESYTVTSGTPVSWQATVAGPVTAEDLLTTTIDGVPVAYQVAAGDTAATIAAGIAAAVNATTVPDPYSGLPLNGLVVAVNSAAVVTFTAADAGAPFTLACSLDPANAASYAAAPPVPAHGTTSVTGTVAPEDVLVTTVNSVPVSYTAAAADTDTTALAAHIAAAINAAVGTDLATGLPLSSEVQASSVGSVVTITPTDPSTPVTVTCSAPNADGYTAAGPFPEQATATVTGTIPAGTILTTTVDTVSLVYMVQPGDTADTIAAAVAGLVNGATTTVDPVAGLPLIQVVTATAAGGVVTLTAASTTTPFTLAATMSASGYSAGQATPPFADDGYGDFLADPAQKLLGHEPTLAAAFNLTGAEFALITTALGFDSDTPLTLANVSLVFRYGWLAHALGLSVVEFLLLRQQTGLDPFLPLDPAATAPAEPPAVRFLRLLGLLRTAGLTTSQALYLMWNQDITGTSSPPLTTVTGLALALAADFAAIEAQFTLQVDPDGSIAQNLMTLVYGASATAFFFGLLNGTLITSVPYSTPAGDQSLPQQVTGASAGRLSYDNLAKQLMFAGVLDPATQAAIDAAITASAPDVAALTAAVAALATASQQATGPFFTTYPELLPLYLAYVASADPPQDKRTTLLDNFLPTLKLKRQQEQALAAITSAAGTDPSFATALLQDPAILHADSDPAAPAVADLVAIANQGLSAQFFLGNNPAATPDMTVDSVPVLSYSPAGPNQLPAGSGGDIAGVWSGYLTVPQDGFYDITVTADAGSGVSLQLGGLPVAGSATGGLWSNTAPISLTAGALVPVTITATSIKTTFTVTWQSQGMGWQPIPAQYLYPLTLVTRLGNSYVRFLKAASLASGLSLTAAEIAYLGTAIPSVSPSWLNLLIGSGWLSGPQAGPDQATAASLAGVLKALTDFARMKQALSPSDGRLLAVLQNPGATLPVSPAVAQLPATALPVTGSALLSLTGWTLASVNALLTQFFGSTSPASLTSVENLSRVYDAYTVVTTCGLAAPVLISAITNAPTPSTVSALQSALRAQYAPADWLTVIGPINDTARTSQRDALVAYILQRLGDSYELSLTPLATTAPAATGATQLTFTATTQIAGNMTVQGTAVAPGTYVTAVSSGAGATTVTLSSGVLTALPAGSVLTFVPAGAVAVTTADSLYEYFLIDTQNEPPVLTSRILLALSTVQLFVERVVRNLEPQVSPADIDQSQWTWMKRYRVWQANREVFLWPENWLYPELRDDQSPFFRQMMSSLLQGDITDDAAATAYLSYLTSLEEVAKLEQCGLYYVSGTADADQASYVIARTAGAHRKYYFRQLASGGWTPWTQVQIDCEDMPVTPIVWNNRLFLFWLKIVKQGQMQPTALSSSSSTGTSTELASLTVGDLNSSVQSAQNALGQSSVQAQAVLCWTEFYNGTWQPAKTSDPNRPTGLGTFDTSGPDSVESYRNLMRIVPAQFTGTSPGAEFWGLAGQFSLPDDALMLAVTGTGSAVPGGFILHNTHSLPVIIDDISLEAELFGIISVTIPLAAVLDVPGSGRSLGLAISPPYTGGYGQGTFTIGYTGTEGSNGPFTTTLFNYSWQPRCVEPQPWLPDPWGAPFIYEDRRHLFYVVTTEHWTRLWQVTGFGMPWTVQLPGSAISPIVLRQPVTLPPPKQILAANAPADPAIVQRYLSQQTDLKAALPDQQVVAYQGQVITPTGSRAAASPGTGPAEQEKEN